MAKREKANVHSTPLDGGCKLIRVGAWDMTYADPEPLRGLAEFAADSHVPLTASELAWLRQMPASSSREGYFKAIGAWRNMGASDPSVALERKVEAFRSLVFKGIEKALAKNPQAKRYEGTVLLHWPNYIDLRERTNAFYKLSLSCSVLCPDAPHSAWQGKTWSEVFAKATRDVEGWIAELDAAPKPARKPRTRKPKTTPESPVA